MTWWMSGDGCMQTVVSTPGATRETLEFIFLSIILLFLKNSHSWVFFLIPLVLRNVILKNVLPKSAYWHFNSHLNLDKGLKEVLFVYIYILQGPYL